MKGLVLGGGGARGSYQVGVWKALEQLDWKPGVITGTSVGSLNGAMLTAGKVEELERLWLTLTPQEVAVYPPEPQEKDKWRTFMLELIQSGGLDVTPLQNQIDQYLEEEETRNSPIKFGLVTVEMRGLKPHELTLEEIPRGKLGDYLMASSACFPAFRPREIDGVKYIDGGYTDNMPFHLAARMGATELLCVDLNGIGINRINNTGLPTKVIGSRWSLGGLLTFSPENAKRNIALGQLDCLRSFGRYEGEWYALTPDPEFWADLGDAVGVAASQAVQRMAGSGLAGLMEGAASLSQSLDLSQKLALPTLEREARELDLDPTIVYTPRQLGRRVLEESGEGAAKIRKLLFGEEDPITLGENAQILSRPAWLGQAVVCQALGWILQE